ncbi:uncharacterized protein EV420DRAFT_1582048 [Desarmillaria tabescens]|uniref:Uncharacterized protein n=1 Tax=Armillaria tabescens TaxID=1929756 RepID=A0AA39JF48_ARMTA|nr:uncharacterized protein EV420DRAFT_1582048 [Desarmillaria tabescens]KAK0440184.1 hypothetical protein EV420DRAFT_1582048 [Desarmillaria tabescens]
MNRIFMPIPFLLFTSHAYGEPISPEDDQGMPASSKDQRTVLNIIWSCLATIFACTWLAIHPNIPGRNITTKGAIYCAIERMRLMIAAIFAPEVIVAWATAQFMVAWKVRHGEKISIASVIHAWREKSDESKPTLAHGFFLSMGGFYYTHMPESVYEDLLNRTTDSDSLLLSDCSWETENIRGVIVGLRQLKSHPGLAKTLVTISAETIEDKSKGDALSKTISILQISWFIVQCIARGVQGLPITLLEMAALAFACLSIMTYCLWWHKPLNVSYHISLDPLNSSELMRTLATKSHKKSASPMASSGDYSIGGVINALTWVCWVVADFFFFLEEEAHRNIGEGACPLSSGTSNDSPIRLMVGICVGSLFGAFHCMAWSSYFPSHTEMVLWRFSSVAVMIGVLTAVSAFIVRGSCPKWMLKLRRLLPYWWMDSSIWGTVWKPCSFSLSAVGGIIYIVGRIILIVLAFTQLRSLPQLAFHTVQWTNYIPHI